MGLKMLEIETHRTYGEFPCVGRKNLILELIGLLKNRLFLRNSVSVRSCFLVKAYCMLEYYHTWYTGFTANTAHGTGYSCYCSSNLLASTSGYHYNFPFGRLSLILLLFTGAAAVPQLQAYYCPGEGWSNVTEATLLQSEHHSSSFVSSSLCFKYIKDERPQPQRKRPPERPDQRPGGGWGSEGQERALLHRGQPAASLEQL